MAGAQALRPVLAGTSGFSYPAWKGTFYPEKLPAKSMLAHYAGVFRAVEINMTFRMFPSEKVLAAWKGSTPPEFQFACKAPQTITHRKRLKDAGRDARDFWTRLGTLGSQRGPVLFQLPPNLKADLPRLTTFLAELPDDIEAAFEFRHESWFADDVYAALRARRVALCIADGDELSTPVVATAPLAYLRLRREDYTDADIDRWAAVLRDTTGWERAYVFFKHEDAGRGPAYAQALLARLA